MNPTPTEPTEEALELWRLRQNLRLSPQERLEQLRVWQDWTARHGGLARLAVRKRPEAAGS